MRYAILLVLSKFCERLVEAVWHKKRVIPEATRAAGRLGDAAKAFAAHHVLAAIGVHKRNGAHETRDTV